MSSTAKTARAALKSKAQRLVGPDPRGTPIDASGYTPPDAEDATVQTGMRPLSPRQFKKGGKVIGKHHGKDAVHHAGRKPRKSGGRANRFLTPDNLINRDVKMANEERVGTKHIGGMKRGGAAKHKLGGGPIGANPVSQSISNTTAAAMPRKDGGKAKWIQGAIKHPGSLHKALHVPAGEKIPAKKLEKASHSENPKLAKKANLAKTLKAMHHAEGGKVKHKHFDKADELADKDLIKSMVKSEALKHKKHGGEIHHASCKCSKCWGGRAGKKDGGRNIMEVTGVRPTGGRIAKKDGGRLHREAGGRGLDTPDFSGAYYDLFTGWHNLDKANPDQIAHMNPQDRQMALAAQGPSRAVVPPHRAAPRKPSPMAAGPSDLSMMDPQQRAELASQTVGSGRGVSGPTADDMRAYQTQQAQRAMQADNASIPASLRYDQQQNMMGRGLPPSRTQYGLFQGQAGEPAMVFSRQVPDASVGPIWHGSQPSSSSTGSVAGDLAQSDMDDYAQGQARGGRAARKDGGRTKGKTNVNIVIAPHPHGGMGQSPAPMMGNPAGGARPVPVPPPVPGMPMGAPAGMPPQGMMPPQAGGMAMARKSGGRTNYPIKDGSRGGMGRLEKAKAYGLKPAR
jgi:hypothetical protein